MSFNYGATFICKRNHDRCSLYSCLFSTKNSSTEEEFEGLPRWRSWSRIHLPMQEKQEMQIWSLGQKMVPHSSILAWEIPWTEEPGGLQSVRLQRVGHNWTANTHTHEETAENQHTRQTNVVQMFERISTWLHFTNFHLGFLGVWSFSMGSLAHDLFYCREIWAGNTEWMDWGYKWEREKTNCNSNGHHIV